ncbi:MAG: pilus assembly protein, partial [Hyphomicrobiales bacterium]|nr:pilus assembly protein [Hyphomicrobiales bacterium]
MKRFRRDSRASTLIEFGLIALPFFALLMAILEAGFGLYASVALESAVQHAARDVFIGQSKLSSYTNVTQFINGELCNPAANDDYALMHAMSCSLL